MASVKFPGAEAYALWLAVTRQAVPDADLDVHIDARKRFRAWETALKGDGVKFDDLPVLKVDFTEAELRYLEKQRAAWGEKQGWPSELAEGVRDVKQRLATALAPPPADIGQDAVKPTRQARRLKGREAS